LSNIFIDAAKYAKEIKEKLYENGFQETFSEIHSMGRTGQ